MSIPQEYFIKLINRHYATKWLLTKHYAKRLPSISFCYGLFDINKNLIGICTIGKPASNNLCFGVCGIEYSEKVFELNRLVVKENLPKNVLSFFVGQVLKRLNQLDMILISYADTGQNHCGYIYQATNWIYTGATKARTDKKGKNGKHSRHTLDNEKERVNRTSKHRYIYFLGKKKKQLRKSLKYEVLPYPKTENQRYIIL